jgi:hypothetical protein
VKRLEVWQRLLPVPATANQITLRNFCETLPEHEQADLQRFGVLAKFQMVGLASDKEFQQQLARFLQKGAVFSSNWMENCFVTPVKADACLRDHILFFRFRESYVQPTDCESLALLIVETAAIVGHPSCLLTNDQLWARFLQLLVEYADRYDQSFSSPAFYIDCCNWLEWVLRGVWRGNLNLQSDFLAFVRATASGATEGQTDERAR